MRNTRSFVYLRTTALIALLPGALSSLYFVINAGRNNNSVLLRGLFVIWVLSPFVALLVVNSIAKGWSFLTRKTIYWLMLIITAGSLLSYSGAFNIHETKRAFIFLVVPLLSWVLLIIAVVTTLKLRRTDNSSNLNINFYIMEKVKSPVITLVTLGAVIGNILFVLWITYNGINEGFEGTLPEKISYVTLMGLLITNVFLIVYRKTSIK